MVAHSPARTIPKTTAQRQRSGVFHLENRLRSDNPKTLGVPKKTARKTKDCKPAGVSPF